MVALHLRVNLPVANNGFETDPDEDPLTPRNGSVTKGHSIYPQKIDSRVSGDFNVVAHSLIKTKDGITTFRAVLHGSIDTVVKFAWGEKPSMRLLAQAHYYRHELKELQGSYIPILYGLFTGNILVRSVEIDKGNGWDFPKLILGAEEVVGFCCMILEDCGTSLDIPRVLIQDLPLPEKQRVMVVLGQFHLLGLLPAEPDPDDICEEHLLRKDKKFRTIGFHKLARHQCEFKDWKFHLRHQSSDRLGCRSLWMTATDCCVWDRITGTKVYVGELEFPNNGILPQQDVINTLVEPWMLHPNFIVHLGDWLMDLQEWRKEQSEKDNVQDWDDVLHYALLTKPKFDEINAEPEE